ncbi:hypothetical protein [Verrucosispora sp. WMMC514]|uniref:hypothetical protein n=1 Tax=Verrucosispora sp. WMMC514 TaxID=3015156 RepID=UPI00248B655C|nr:hypothetical protein [Verrucosispora sp. WMMC514]WBB94166.1 hypothetical protein O7597_15055 [Verrucosispora sp. WMMC514]
MDPIILPVLPTYQFSPTLAGLLSLVLTIILPILAALLMRASWSAWRKGLVLLALATAKSYVEAWLLAVGDNVAFNHVTTLYGAGVTFGIAVAMYVGLLKGTPVQQAALRGGFVNDRPRHAEP